MLLSSYLPLQFERFGTAQLAPDNDIHQKLKSELDTVGTSRAITATSAELKWFQATSDFETHFKSDLAAQATKLVIETYNSADVSENVIAKAEESLAICKNCEAYNALALFKAKTFEEALDFYREGAKALDEVATVEWRKRLGSGGELSSFSYVPLRGYLRAKQGEATCLRKLQRWEEALAIFLELEKLDNRKIMEKWEGFCE